MTAREIMLLINGNSEEFCKAFDESSMTLEEIQDELDLIENQGR